MAISVPVLRDLDEAAQVICIQQVPSCCFADAVEDDQSIVATGNDLAEYGQGGLGDDLVKGCVATGQSQTWQSNMQQVDRRAFALAGQGVVCAEPVKVVLELLQSTDYPDTSTAHSAGILSPSKDAPSGQDLFWLN